ncbi:MAG: type II secretion system F family protein [Endomicrobiales bacterium]|nr:type II secretion system F family protein [Endomicrobiales bacterium]
MTLVFQAAAVLFAGLLAFIVINRVVSFASKKISSIKVVSEEAGSSGAPKEKLGAVKTFLAPIASDPKSSSAKKAKAAVSVAVFLFFWFLTDKAVFSLLPAAALFWGLGAYFDIKQKKYVILFEEQLIEALGVITNSVRAGQSLVQALENMVKDAKPPLSAEFSRALNEIRFGTPIGEALTGISDRVDSKDLKIVITSINLARESGGNIGEILTRIAETMRDRRKIKGKIAALTAQGKMSGIVMGCVPFVLLAVLYFIEPALMGLLFTNIFGNIMLFIAVIMVSLGMFFINKIVNIDI